LTKGSGKKLRPKHAAQLDWIHSDPEILRKKSESAKRSPKVRAQLKRIHANHTEQWRQRNREQLARLHADPEYKRRIAEFWARVHADKEIQARIRASMGARPNGLEAKVLACLRSADPLGGWTYTGGGENILKDGVGLMFPDFTSWTRHAVIEAFGDYWHQGQDPLERVSRFNSIGWRAAVIWESAFRKNQGLAIDLALAEVGA
jgi:hypothetical protein